MTERAVILCDGNSLGINDFRIKPFKSEVTVPKDEVINLKIHETNLIRKALQNFKYNQQAAADALGISRDALIRKMKKYEISVVKSEEK